jgi:glycerophosphoryl diester phosphodiesterase
LGLGINLEIKPDPGRKAETARVALDRAAALWRDGSGLLLVSSFDGVCLEVARDFAPQWPRGLLVEAVPEDWRGRAEAYDCATVHADHRHLDRDVVAAIRETGRPVLAYTVNDGERARELREMGIASIFSDTPQM